MSIVEKRIIKSQDLSQFERDLQSFKSDPELWSLIPDGGVWKVATEAKLYRMSRSYVFVWNQRISDTGVKKSPALAMADEDGFYPIKCTLFKTHNPHLDLYHYVYEECKQEFQRRVEDLYKHLVEKENLSTALKDQFERVLGIGPYAGQGLQEERFQDVAKEQKYKKTHEERFRLISFAKTLPRKLLKELAFRIAWDKFKAERHTTGGERLTFYPMQDWYPYLLPETSTIDVDKLKSDLEQLKVKVPPKADWVVILNLWLEKKYDGNNEKEPLECKKAFQGANNKTFADIVSVRGRGPLEGKTIHFKSIENDGYKPYVYDDTIGNELMFKRDIADNVLHKWAMRSDKPYVAAEKGKGGKMKGITYYEAVFGTSQDPEKWLRVDLTETRGKGLFRSDIVQDGKDMFKVRKKKTKQEKPEKKKERKIIPLVENLMELDLEASRALKSISKYAQMNENDSWFDWKLQSYNSEDELIDGNDELWTAQDKILVMASIIPKLVEELSTAAESVQEPVVAPEQVSDVEKTPVWERGKKWFTENIVEPTKELVQPTEPEYGLSMAETLKDLERLSTLLKKKKYVREARRIDITVKKMKTNKQS